LASPAHAAPTRDVERLLDEFHAWLLDDARRLATAPATPETLREIAGMLATPLVSGHPRAELYARYVEIARLFGWESLNAYWYSINKDYERGKDIDTSVDGLILRMSKAVGVDVTPLLHFWGRQPQDYGSLQAAIDNAGLPRSREIYDLLVQYQASVHEDNAAFKTFAVNWWEGVPESDDPTTTKGYHATLMDTYNKNRASELQAVIQRIIDEYFPTGRPSAN
jgi:hypothetical protein